jgi:alkylhydroperoxidase family enzyme
MARLPYIERADLRPEHQDLVKREIALYKQLVHSPNMLRAFQTVGYHIRFGSPMNQRLRELAILQVGWLARSAYEWSHHVKIGYDFGVTDDDIQGLIDDTAGRPSSLDPLAKTVIKAAREVTRDGKVSDATFAAMKAEIPNEELVDLIVTMSFYNAVVRILASLEIDVEPEYEKFLERWPLPKG